jgi:hypothetical protein
LTLTAAIAIAPDHPIAQGDAGLSALYPGDVGIENHPAVIYSPNDPPGFSSTMLSITSSPPRATSDASVRRYHSLPWHRETRALCVRPDRHPGIPADTVSRRRIQMIPDRMTPRDVIGCVTAVPLGMAAAKWYAAPASAQIPTATPPPPYTRDPCRRGIEQIT